MVGSALPLIQNIAQLFFIYRVVTAVDFEHDHPISEGSAPAKPIKPKSSSKPKIKTVSMYKATAQIPAAVISTAPIKKQAQVLKCAPPEPSPSVPLEPLKVGQLFKDREQFEKAARRYAESQDTTLRVYQSGVQSGFPGAKLCCNFGGVKSSKHTALRCTYQVHANLDRTRDFWYAQSLTLLTDMLSACLKGSFAWLVSNISTIQKLLRKQKKQQILT